MKGNQSFVSPILLVSWLCLKLISLIFGQIVRCTETEIMAETRIQISIDSTVSKKANQVIEGLGLTPSIVLTALYKRIIAKGELPFEVELTRCEKANLVLVMATKHMESKQVESPSGMEEWLDGEEGV